MRHFSKLRHGYIPAAFTTLAALTSSVAAEAAPFTAGNVVVYRVGDTVLPLANTGAQVFLDEYSPTGALVQSIALPTAAALPQHRLVASGVATSEGLLTRSADKRFLVLTGYDSAIPAAGSLANTTVPAVPRTIGRVDAAGVVDTTTTVTDAFSANNPRSAASVDGTGFWVAGGNSGVRYALLGNSISDSLSTNFTNLRQLNVFGGQLYVSAGASTLRLGTVGVGTPIPPPTVTTTNLPGFPVTGSQYAYFLADLDAGVAGVDVLYIADDTPVAGSFGVAKYSLVGGAWTANGGVGVDADDYRGLTGVVAGGVTLYATRAGGSAAAGGGQLVSITDAAGYNAVMVPSVTPLASALTGTSANTAFRGVAMAPEAPAVACEPFETTLEMSLFPHPAFNLPVYAHVESPGCASQPAESCTVRIDLNPATPDADSLRVKCELLTQEIATECGPRFALSDVTCANGFSTFTVRDTACVGQAPQQAGDGLLYAMSNSPEGLANFTSGAVLPDYERDTVVPGCADTSNSGTLVGLLGSASGQSAIEPGAPGQVQLAIGGGSQPLTVLFNTPSGMTAANAVAGLVQRANAQLGSQGVQCRVQTDNGRFFTCVELPSQVPLVVSLSSNDTGLGHTNAAGAAAPMAKLLTQINSNTIPNLQALIEGAPVPVLGRWGAGGLALAMAALGSVAAVRRRGRNG